MKLIHRNTVRLRTNLDRTGTRTGTEQAQNWNKNKNKNRNKNKNIYKIFITFSMNYFYLKREQYIKKIKTPQKKS